MATIYRFIIEQKQAKGGASGDGRQPRPTTGTKKVTAKKGRWVSIFGEKGGVEHNRKMRAINPLLNRITGGWWEKGTRLGRAGIGLFQRNTDTGKIGISGTAFAIIIAFIIITLMKWQQQERLKAEKSNAQDFKRLENGYGAIYGQYKTTQNFFTGRITYNQNK